MSSRLVASERLPRVVKSDRVGPIFEGLVESSSRPGKRHYGHVLVTSSVLCGCEASRMGGHVCLHMRALLMSMTQEDLVDAILEGAEDPTADRLPL